MLRLHDDLDVFQTGVVRLQVDLDHDSEEGSDLVGDVLHQREYTRYSDDLAAVVLADIENAALRVREPTRSTRGTRRAKSASTRCLVSQGSWLGGLGSRTAQWPALSEPTRRSRPAFFNLARWYFTPSGVTPVRRARALRVSVGSPLSRSKIRSRVGVWVVDLRTSPRRCHTARIGVITPAPHGVKRAGRSAGCDRN